MLKMRKTINLAGESIIDGVIVEGYNASIDSNNLENVQFGSWINDPVMYKANRIEARADQAAFEDAVYAIQDELIANAAESDVTEE